MQLYEKIDFMMNLTQTTNRELAGGIQIDPSLVSRLRNGKRGAPRNQELLRSMAVFFSGRCSTEYQRRAISEIVGIKRAITAKTGQLSEILFYWFCGEVDEVDRFIQDFETLKIDESVPRTIQDSQMPVLKGTCLYYGNEGKRNAVRAAYRHLLSLHPAPGPIYVFMDETDDWLIEDYDFTSGIYKGIKEILEQGFHIHQITPSIYSGDQILETLSRCIPLYMTGRVTAYFYPHIRDRLYRHSLFMIPGIAAVTSYAMAGQGSSYYTMVTTDPPMLRTLESEFRDYLSLCRPMLTACSEPQKLVSCFIKFLSAGGCGIQQLISLSAETAPRELMEYCIDKSENEDLKNLGRRYLQEMNHLEQDRENYNLIDIVCLASAQQVRDGLVPIITSCGTPEILYYTPETYSLHLTNILHLLETCENYHFVPLKGTFDKESVLMVKENHRALLVHLSNPFTVFEISQPEIVSLYREHLIRLAEKHGYTGFHRSKIKSQIRELIRELHN